MSIARRRFAEQLALVEAGGFYGAGFQDRETGSAAPR